MSAPSGPPRIAIVNDYEIVVTGIAQLLRQFPDRVEIVEIDSNLPVVSDVDIVLFDTFGHVADSGFGLRDLVRPARGPKIVVYTWTADPRSVTTALEQGAAGYLSKALSSRELVEALEAIHAGAVVTSACFEPTAAGDPGDWPGRECGLSPREAETLALIAGGLANVEIAAALHLSTNTIKSNIRATYRKLGVRTRAQAVLWAVEHGFVAEPHRSFAAAD